MAMARIAKGEDAVQVMQEFSYRLTQKLLHPTSILLREAAKGDEPECFEFMQENRQRLSKVVVNKHDQRNSQKDF